MLIVVVGAAALVAATGVGLALAVSGPPVPGAMSGLPGYGSMLGGAAPPGWMTGGTLPRSMMGGGADPGKVMGAVLASAPGPRVSPEAAARLGQQVPVGATVDRTRSRITFHRSTVVLAAVASGPGNPMYSFEIAGMVDPTVVVPTGAHVSIEVVNRDGDMAHGLVVTADGADSSWMPMMTAAPAFEGAAVWVLGDPTSAGLHAATLRFTAGPPGSYEYLCPVPGHAAQGMVGTFTVTADLDR